MLPAHTLSESASAVVIDGQIIPVEAGVLLGRRRPGAPPARRRLEHVFRVDDGLALCGAWPGPASAGWGEADAQAVDCPDCARLLERFGVKPWPRLHTPGGKPLSAAAEAALRQALWEIEFAVGPLADLWEASQLTIVHHGGRLLRAPDGDQVSGLATGWNRIAVGGRLSYGPDRKDGTPLNLAHEMGHWLAQLWTLVVGRGTRPWLQRGLRQMIAAAQSASAPEAQPEADEYWGAPEEVWARMFEVHVAWRLMAHPAYGTDLHPSAGLDYHALAYGYATDDTDEAVHEVGFEFAGDWDLFAPRMHRWVQRLLREIRAFPGGPPAVASLLEILVPFSREGAKAPLDRLTRR